MYMSINKIIDILINLLLYIYTHTYMYACKIYKYKYHTPKCILQCN